MENNILKFKPKMDPELKQLLQISDDIDGIVLGALGKKLDARSVAGVLAHRLGTLLGTQKNEILNDICEKIMRERIEK